MDRRVPSRLMQTTDEEQKELYKILGATDERIKDSLIHLKDWYSKQPHLPKEMPDDMRLIGMLITNRLSLESTKNILDAHYAARSIVPEFLSFNRFLENDYQRVSENIRLIPLKHLSSKDLSRVFLYSMAPGAKSFDITDLMLYGFMVAEHRYYTDYPYCSRYIMDLANVKLSHFGKLNIFLLKRWEMISKKIYGLHVTGIHILNPPGFVDKILSVMKQTLKPKVAERIKVYSRLEELHEDISREILPKDYGGDQKDIEGLIDDCRLEYMSDYWKNTFKTLDSLKSDESKRIGTPLEDDMFGSSGSFRQLDVD